MDSAILKSYLIENNLPNEVNKAHIPVLFFLLCFIYVMLGNNLYSIKSLMKAITKIIYLFENTFKFASNFGGIMDPLSNEYLLVHNKLLSKLSGLKCQRFIISLGFVAQEFGNSLA